MRDGLGEAAGIGASRNSAIIALRHGAYTFENREKYFILHSISYIPSQNIFLQYISTDVQRRCSKRVPSLFHLSYLEKLNALGLEPL